MSHVTIFHNFFQNLFLYGNLKNGKLVVFNSFQVPIKTFVLSKDVDYNLKRTILDLEIHIIQL